MAQGCPVKSVVVVLRGHLVEPEDMGLILMATVAVMEGTNTEGAGLVVLEPPDLKILVTADWAGQ